MSDVCARRLAAACLVACSLLGSVRLCAQATGAVAGLVSDTSGGVLPGVTVDVTNQDTGQVRTAVSSNDGFYTIPLLTPGRYEVKATLGGFRTTVRGGIVVVVNETARADLQLQVGSVEERVTVQAESPLVETTNATLGVVIDRQKIVDLPLNGRNFTQLGTLTPGVVAPPVALGGQNGDATPGGFGNVTGGFNVNGQRTSRTISCSTDRRTTIRSTPASSCARRPTPSRNSRSSRIRTMPNTAATPVRS